MQAEGQAPIAAVSRSHLSEAHAPWRAGDVRSHDADGQDAMRFHRRDDP